MNAMTANLASGLTDAIVVVPARISHPEFSILADNEGSNDDIIVHLDNLNYAVVHAVLSAFDVTKPEPLDYNPLLLCLSSIGHHIPT